MFARSQRPGRMQRLFRDYVGCMCSFWRVVQAEVLCAACDANERNVPARLVTRHAKQTELIVFACAALILVVCRVVRFTQVVYVIVVANAVTVVQQVRRPAAFRKQPGQSVRVMHHLINAYLDVAVAFSMPCTISRQPAPFLHTPDEHTGFGVVIQQLAQAIRSQWDNVFAHAACPPDKGLGSYSRGLPAPRVALLYAEVPRVR